MLAKLTLKWHTSDGEILSSALVFDVKTTHATTYMMMMLITVADCRMAVRSERSRFVFDNSGIIAR